MKNSLELMRAHLIEHYTNILKTIIYLNSVSQSNGTIVESISSLNNEIIKKSFGITANNETITNGEGVEVTTTTTIEDDNIQSSSNNNNNQQNILAVLNYLKFTGFIDYYIDNMKKDKITITISPVISAFLLQYYFEISNVLDNSNNSSSLLKDPKHKEDEKILLLQKLFVTSSLATSGAAGAAQSTSIEY
jgi:hypothetical protein